ncbi:hypothetical protein TM49_00355 [Martelella endophytica]|uniref:Uncharacterized protein n=1 Tax=Martelella endophytica TaxID=1486262 RepID=A0A0D5LJW5_MAREN|nr:hypothetical protein TM49_00355 [Martelella endophytica]
MFVYDQIKKIYDLVIVAELRGLDEASAIADFVASRLGWEKFRQAASLIKVVARMMRIGQDILHVGIDSFPRELLFGTPYGIISEWSAIFQGRVDRDVSRSRYRR